MHAGETQKPTLTIGILTMNERRHIRACIESARFADEIVVVDSGSNDGTVEIAREMGAKVHIHTDWQGFAVQRNRLLQYATGQWIFFLDADERITPALAAEITAAIQDAPRASFKVAWEQIAFGQSLARMGNNGAVVRLFERGQIIEFSGLVHEGALLRDAHRPVRNLKNRLLHYSRETVYGSLQKLAQYVQLGAAQRARAGRRGGVLRGAASAMVIFLKMYVVNRAFLCGRAGFLHCFFLALERFLRYVAIETDQGHFEKTAVR